MANSHTSCWHCFNHHRFVRQRSIDTSPGAFGWLCFDSALILVFTEIFWLCYKVCNTQNAPLDCIQYMNCKHNGKTERMGKSTHKVITFVFWSTKSNCSDVAPMCNPSSNTISIKRNFNRKLSQEKPPKATRISSLSNKLSNEFLRSRLQQRGRFDRRPASCVDEVTLIKRHSMLNEANSIPWQENCFLSIMNKDFCFYWISLRLSEQSSESGGSSKGSQNRLERTERTAVIVVEVTVIMVWHTRIVYRESVV